MRFRFGREADRAAEETIRSDGKNAGYTIMAKRPSSAPTWSMTHKAYSNSLSEYGRRLALKARAKG